MNLSAFDIIIILLFFFAFKWGFRILAGFVSLKVTMLAVEQGKKALKEKVSKLGMGDDDSDRNA